MKIIRLIIIVFCVCLCNIINAQSITGKVVDKNLNPMAYVSCILSNADDSAFVTSTTTGTDGVFVINTTKEREYIVKISILGYLSQSIKCKSGDIGTVTLEEDRQMLNEVVVKGQQPLIRMENNRLTYNVAAIIGKKIVSNAHELLKELPSVISLDGNSINLAGAARTTIRIQGKPSQLSNSQLYDFLKSIPAEDVDKVEIIYNPPPQWHTSGAVINVVLKKKRTYTLNGQLQGNATNKHANSFDTGGSIIASSPKWNADVIYKFANRNSKQNESVQSLHTLPDAVYDITSGTDTESSSNSHSIYTGLGYNINNTSTIDFSYNAKFVPKSSNRLYSKSNMFSNAMSNINGDNYMHNIALSYNSTKGQTAGVEYTDYTNTNTQNMTLFDGNEYDNVITYWRKQHIGKLRVYTDLSHSLKNDLTLCYGASYSYAGNTNKQDNTSTINDENSTYISTLDIKEHTAQLYAGAQKTFWQGKLSVSVYLTGELYKIGDYKKNALLPNIELTYIPSAANILQLSYNSLRTYPSYWQRQDYTSYSNEYVVSEGNPLLRPARTSNINAMYVYKNKYILQMSYFRVSDFFIEQSYQKPDKLQMLSKPFNIDYTSSFNITSVIPVNIGSRFSSNLIASVYNEIYKSHDWYGMYYNREKWTGTAMVNSTLILSRKPKLSANMMLFYRTPTILGIYDQSSNWGVNAGLRYSFLKDMAILSLQCNDIFESFYPKTKVRFENQHQDMSPNKYSRSITLNLTYKFKGFKEKQYKEVDTSRFGM